MNYKNFEDLPIWNNARKIVNDIYKITNLDKLKRDFRLTEQLRGAAISIMNNIACPMK